MTLLDREFQWRSSERSVAKVNLRNTFQKLAKEGVRKFRTMFQKMVGDLSYCGLPLIDDVIYVRSLPALSFAEHQRLVVIAATSQSHTPYNPKVLEDVAFRLLNQPLKLRDAIVCQAETEMGENYEEMDTWIAKERGRNRPDMGIAAIKGTSESANYHNSPPMGRL